MFGQSSNRLKTHNFKSIFQACSGVGPPDLRAPISPYPLFNPRPTTVSIHLRIRLNATYENIYILSLLVKFWLNKQHFTDFSCLEPYVGYSAVFLCWMKISEAEYYLYTKLRIHRLICCVFIIDEQLNNWRWQTTNYLSIIVQSGAILIYNTWCRKIVITVKWILHNIEIIRECLLGMLTKE